MKPPLKTNRQTNKKHLHDGVGELGSWWTYQGTGRMAHLEKAWKFHAAYPTPSTMHFFHLTIPELIFYDKPVLVSKLFLCSVTHSSKLQTQDGHNGNPQFIASQSEVWETQDL